MAEKPILFSAPMVLAILADLKTQTRRLTKFPSTTHLCADFECVETIWRQADGGFYCATCGSGVSTSMGREGEITLRPPIGVGDRIWVRETLKRGADGRWKYFADGAHLWLPAGDARIADMTSWAHHKQGDTCVSIHMPRWACRILLDVVDVRIERLRDISEADALTEGVREPSLGDLDVISPEFIGKLPRSVAPPLVLWEFLWKRINGDASWDANPWVCVYTFKRVQP